MCEFVYNKREGRDVEAKEGRKEREYDNAFLVVLPSYYVERCIKRKGFLAYKTVVMYILLPLSVLSACQWVTNIHTDMSSSAMYVQRMAGKYALSLWTVDGYAG